MTLVLLGIENMTPMDVAMMALEELQDVRAIIETETMPEIAFSDGKRTRRILGQLEEALTCIETAQIAAGRLTELALYGLPTNPGSAR